MTDKPNSGSGRMLLSHNFTLIEEETHPLNREEFAEVFIQGLDAQAGLSCSAIENPHWVVEVHYETDQYAPSEVGQLCVDTLAKYRAGHQSKGFFVMALGGLKTTPPTSGPPSLQVGEWGVDMVETHDPDMFLEEINWHKLTGARPEEDVFKVDYSL